MKPVLIIPLLYTLVVGLLTVYVVGGPVRAIMETLTVFLREMGTNADRVRGNAGADTLFGGTVPTR